MCLSRSKIHVVCDAGGGATTIASTKRRRQRPGEGRRDREPPSIFPVSWARVICICASMGFFIATASLFFLFNDGGSITVDGFVTSQPQNQRTATASRETSIPGPNMTATEDPPLPSSSRNPPHPSARKDFYRPSQPSDFATFHYSSNPTAFGKILRGELKTRVLAETEHLLAFEDRAPAADFHGLVIPKRHVRSVFDLRPGEPASLELVRDLHAAARALLARHSPDAYDTGDYVVCFHVPPFYSVDHLHLHVLAPASTMAWWRRDGKYRTLDRGSEVRWAVSLADVEARLVRGEPPTLYSPTSSWATMASDVLSSLCGILSCDGR